MKNVPESFLTADQAADDEDIDKLFSHLQQFTPPANMVERIMQVVGNLPSPRLETKKSEQYFEGFLVDETHKQPS